MGSDPMNSFSDAEAETQGKRRDLPKATKPLRDWLTKVVK